MKTVQMTTANTLMFLAQNPDLKERLLNEIMPVMTEVKDNILEKLTYSKVQDFDFLIRCFYESLRIEPPVPVSSNQCFSEDVTINGFTFRAGDAFWVCMGAIQHDPTQWQQPDQYIPDRFDSNSKWYKTPDGANRNPLSFTPFLGGKRGCLGKTFAETVIRFTLPIFLYHFDFEFEDQAQKACKPKINMACTSQAVIPFKITNKVIT